MNKREKVLAKMTEEAKKHSSMHKARKANQYKQAKFDSSAYPGKEEMLKRRKEFFGY